MEWGSTRKTAGEHLDDGVASIETNEACLGAGKRVKTKPNIAIIGAGKVGLTIATAAGDAGFPVRVGARNPASAVTYDGESVPPWKVEPIDEVLVDCEVVLLTVSDDAIQAVCECLVNSELIPVGCTVIHCSGAIESDVLQAAKTRKCHIGSMHPLQTFPSVAAGLKKLPNTYWFYEGDDAACEVIVRLVKQLDGTPVRIASGAKALYHAAAVIACNYLTTLMDVALAVGEQAELDRLTYFQALMPLISATLENIERSGTASALTGPIARGDIKTIETHLHALRNAPEQLANIYQCLGQRTVELAVEKMSIDLERAELLRKLLTTQRD